MIGNEHTFPSKKLVRSSIHIQLLTETIAHPMLLLTVSLWTGFQCSTIFIISHLTWLLLTKWPFHDKSLIGSRFLVAQPLFICLELLKSEWTDRKRILQSSSPRCNVPSEVSPAVRYIGNTKMVSSCTQGNMYQSFLNGGQPFKQLQKRKLEWMVNPQFDWYAVILSSWI